MERRLLEFGEVEGWCFGAFGEASEGVHHLVERLAEARLEFAQTQPHQRGQVKSRAAEKACLVSYVRRTLYLTCVKEQSLRWCRMFSVFITGSRRFLWL